MGDRRGVLVETLYPTKNSIRWTLEIKGEGAPWSTDVQTHIAWPVGPRTKFWMAWSKEGTWADPLLPTPFDTLRLTYGSSSSVKFKQGFSLPVATIIEPGDDRGISFIASPEDTVITMEVMTTSDGQVTVSRSNRRISADVPLRYSMDIIAHEGDWRPAVAWLRQRYSSFFVPQNATVHEVAGPSAYSGYRGQLDSAFYRQIGFGFNWFASRSWPYLGMFLPPVADEENWNSWTGFGSETSTVGRSTSFRAINDDYRAMHRQGLHLLAYFNLTEFGYQIKYPKPDGQPTPDQPLWQDSNAYLHAKLRDAVLYTKDGRAYFSWNRSVVMDPAHSVYEAHLVEHLRRHIEKVPDFDGICIDRLDWFEKFNFRRDDGISWAENGPCAAMILSWHQIMRKVEQLLHPAGKVIFSNPHLARLDLMGPVDGIFDENANVNSRINLTALLGVSKPVIGWIHGEEDLQPNPDEMMQRHLYLGVYPMAPFPQANHSLKPSDGVTRLYRDYGPMLIAMKGKEWVLLPHVIATDSTVKANVFKTAQGFIIPVVFGQANPSARLTISNQLFAEKRGQYRVDFIRPGERTWQPIRVRQTREKMDVVIPLTRGCAMLRIRHKQQSRT